MHFTVYRAFFIYFSTAIEAQNWLKVFANLSTDDIKSALHTSLKPLASQGLTKSFLHDLIIARQIKRSESAQRRWRAEQGLHNEAEEHSIYQLLKASLQRQEVDQQLMQFVSASSVSNTHKDADKPVTVGVPDCRAQASYYFPITQYVAAQYGSTHSGIGLLEEVRLIVSGGVAPEGHAGDNFYTIFYLTVRCILMRMLSPQVNAHFSTFLFRRSFVQVRRISSTSTPKPRHTMAILMPRPGWPRNISGG